MTIYFKANCIKEPVYSQDNSFKNILQTEHDIQAFFKFLFALL